MATIKDIAKRLGIAISTVSKGLNGASDISEDTRKLVIDTAVEMGYTSKRIKGMSRHKVCILIENMDYENIEQFGYEIITGFKISAAMQDYEVSVIPTNLNMQTKEKYDVFMFNNGFCGAFLLGFALHDDYVKQLDKTTVPTVLFDNYIENNLVGYIGTDSFEGIDVAIKYLAENGHKKIAFLNGSKNSMVSDERYKAFIQSMKASKLSVNKKLIDFGYYVPDCAKYHVPSFLKNGATAILCASDLIASGVITELKKLNKRIPEDISVIGFDDLPIAQYLSPKLTTIRQDRTSLGKSAFIVLDGLINGVSISKMLLKPKFVLRESAGKCIDSTN